MNGIHIFKIYRATEEQLKKRRSNNVVQTYPELTFS